MTVNRTRLGGWALIIGTIVAAGGYLAAGTLIRGHGDVRYTSSLWAPLNGIAIAGNIIVALGLPVILACHGRRAARLTLVGYLGLFAALTMLNISEGCIEAFVKPYLVTHGGIPDNPPGGFLIFENIALVFMLVGLICMGIAVIRARVFPRWVGALFIVSPFVAFSGLPGPFAELSDYLAFIALAAIGLQVVRTSAQHPASAAALAEAVPTAP
jgi:hypothetical protein